MWKNLKYKNDFFYHLRKITPICNAFLCFKKKYNERKFEKKILLIFHPFTTVSSPIVKDRG